MRWGLHGAAPWVEERCAKPPWHSEISPLPASFYLRSRIYCNARQKPTTPRKCLRSSEHGLRWTILGNDDEVKAAPVKRSFSGGTRVCWQRDARVPSPRCGRPVRTVRNDRTCRGWRGVGQAHTAGAQTALPPWHEVFSDSCAGRDSEASVFTLLHPHRPLTAPAPHRSSSPNTDSPPRTGC